MNDWFQTHWPDGVLLGVGFAFLKWLLGREINRRDSKETDHEERLRKLEEGRVTKADMDELRMSLMASMNIVHSDITRSMNSLQSDVRLLTTHLLGNHTR